MLSHIDTDGPIPEPTIYQPPYRFVGKGRWLSMERFLCEITPEMLTGHPVDAMGNVYLKVAMRRAESKSKNAYTHNIGAFMTDRILEEGDGELLKWPIPRTFATGKNDAPTLPYVLGLGKTITTEHGNFLLIKLVVKKLAYIAVNWKGKAYLHIKKARGSTLKKMPFEWMVQPAVTQAYTALEPWEIATL
jgi:hypothetical protein